MVPQSALIANTTQSHATMMAQSIFQPIFELCEKEVADVILGSTPCRVQV